MTFGEKLKQARMEASLSQEELAQKLAVSRSAIAKWENDRGMPDIPNLKAIAQILNISIDYLLDDGTTLDLSVTRKVINLNDYSDEKKVTILNRKKIKDRIILEAYPLSKIYTLIGTQKSTKAESKTNAFLTIFTTLISKAPLFDLPQLIKAINNTNKEFYLVEDHQHQYFVMITDEMMISKTLVNPIQSKEFDLDDWTFTNCGLIETTK